MNSLDMVRMTYAAPGAPLRTPRAVEYDLFARITRRMRETLAAGPTGLAARIQALDDNLRLWITLAADLADDGNMLTPDLRARLLYLAAFVQAHTPKAMKGAATAEVLIEINTAMMRGLSERGAAQ